MSIDINSDETGEILSMIELYEFAISHYCEKAKWALHYRKIPHRAILLTPGFHTRILRKFARETSVPVIRHGSRVVQGSGEILSYLETLSRERPLTPEGSGKGEALELERYLDEEIGGTLRLFVYHHILPKTGLARSLLLQRSPFIAKFLYFFIFPWIRKKMIQKMNLNAEVAVAARERLSAALHRLDGMLADRDYLVGGRFSRADLTAAALLAPLCFPEKHPFRWPVESLRSLPELEEFRRNHEKLRVFSWVRHLYQVYR